MLPGGDSDRGTRDAPHPYLYTGGYFDVFRNHINMGDRWYEPRQFMYSPDPVLQSDRTLIGDSR
jgi:hypothetical protein